MENKRHCIAVIVSEVCEVYQSLLLQGIKKRAVENNYNVAVFGSFFVKRFASFLNEIGENNIFSLINYDLFDGFIVVPNAIEPEELLNKIKADLLKVGKPVVYIDKDDEDFISVCSDDYNSIKHITNHLIKDHGYRRINCITGFPGMNLSEARLQGYKDALIENGIPLEEDRYTYGDFWRNAPIEFAEKILTCGLELPEAVVCANDTMAITLCEEFAKRGIKVPEQIAVTGFDRIMDGRIFHPKISTMFPSMEEIGKQSAQIIFDILAGKPVQKKVMVKGEFFPAESCGCSINTIEEYREDILLMHKNIESGQFFTNSIYMYEDLQESKNVDDLFIRTNSYLFLLNGMSTIHIFLCENWDELDEEKSMSGTTKEAAGYTSKMITKFSFNGDALSGDLGVFDKSLMFPPLFDDKYKPQMYFFLPVNFQDVPFGYSVSSCLDGYAAPDAIFRSWLKNFSNALEHIRSNQHLKWVLKRLERISEIDSLTGVFNRTGYENRVYKAFESAKEQNKDFLIIMGDLDCLKKINDNYGHAEGDNAIRIIAKAIQNSFTEDEAVARIGGDEFIMFGTGNFDEEKLKEYPKRINEYLDHYNENSSKPYVIAISLGIYCGKVSSDSELKEWLDKADENMYANKKSKIKIFQK